MDGRNFAGPPNKTMRYQSAFATLAMLSFVGGCNTVVPEAKMRNLTVAEGTPVKLILLQELHSGREEEGAEVPLMVAENVVAPDGTVVIQKGTLAKGTVSWSRSEGTVSRFVGQPARLSITLEETLAVDETTVPLRAAKDATAEDQRYHFTVKNTGHVDLGRRMEQIWEKEASREMLSQIYEGFEGGRMPNFESPQTKDALRQLADDLKLEGVARVIEQDQVREMNALLQALRGGNAAKTILSGNALLAVAGVMELANVAGSVGQRLGGMFKGRTIRAHVGTEVQGFVAETVEVRVPENPTKDDGDGDGG
jgi:hypothetical protein